MNGETHSLSGERFVSLRYKGEDFELEAVPFTGSYSPDEPGNPGSSDGEVTVDWDEAAFIAVITQWCKDSEVTVPAWLEVDADGAIEAINAELMAGVFDADTVDQYIVGPPED